MRTVAFCESEPFCRAVLKKHWPDVPVFDDIKRLWFGDEWLWGSSGILANAPRHVREEQEAGRAEWERIRSCSQPIDVICGGFPCQDISVAGKGAGIEGARSGLWSEFARIIGEVRPRYVIVENVAALLGRGIERVLGDLAALGYDAEWHCIPASAVGAPHRRDRVWIVAYADRTGRQQRWRPKSISPQFATVECGGKIPDAAGDRWSPQGERTSPGYAYWGNQLRRYETTHWIVESPVGRVADGISNRLDRLRSLGNAIVPQIAEIIGRAIMDSF